jgi:hypothetical protein
MGECQILNPFIDGLQVTSTMTLGGHEIYGTSMKYEYSKLPPYYALLLI